MKGYTIQHSIELLEKQASSDSGSTTAAQVSFDNTGTGLVATNVQNAISEVNEKITVAEYSSVVLEFTGLTIASATPAEETIEAISGDIIRIGGAFLDSGSYYAIPEAGIRVAISGTTCTFSSSGASTWSGDATLIVDYVPTPVVQSTRTKKKK